MSEDVFHTQIELPKDITLVAMNEFVAWARKQRSLFQVEVDFKAVTVHLVVGNRFSSVKYSDCPLPGTHDFAAGYLAHEAMLLVSKKLGRPVQWVEAEWDPRDRNRHAARIRRRDKPPITIDWATFGE